MHRHSVPAGAAVLLVVGALVGCTEAAAPAGLPDQDQAQWRMPLNQYLPVGDVAADYAENLLMTPCMEAHGYVWEVPWRDVAADQGEVWNDVGRRLFTTDLANRFGYHSGPAGDSGLEAWKEFTSQELSEAQVEVLHACREEVRESLPRLPGSAQLAVQLAQSAYAAALQDSAVTAAAEAWRACMLEVGIPDLPSAPTEMPTESMQQEFELVPGSEIGPSARELEVAVADAKCRESSRFSDALYQAEWTRQVSLVRDNADALARIEQIIKKNEEAVDLAISSHAPSPPS